MGYTKVIQYGDKIELYEYEKSLYRKEKPYSHAWIDGRKVSIVAKSIKQKRAQERRKHSLRSDFSRRRAIASFFRLCHHNAVFAESVYFFTLTFAFDVSYPVASKYVSQFFKRIKSIEGGLSVSYISVPELTKKGRFHFHLLVFNLPSSIAGDTISIRRYNRRKSKFEVVYTTTERFTRNLQRIFRRGYIDICPATKITSGVAGYMAKYMAKSFNDGTSKTRRGYNCSRNIRKIYSAGTNSFDAIRGEIIDVDSVLEDIKEYDTLWLGRALYSKFSKN